MRYFDVSVLYQAGKCSNLQLFPPTFVVLPLHLQPKETSRPFCLKPHNCQSTLPGVNSGLCWVITHNFPGDSLTDAGSGGPQLFLCGSCHLSLHCEAEKILLPGDMGLLAILAGAQHASLNGGSVLQQVVNYLMEPVISSSCANTSLLSIWAFFSMDVLMFLASKEA